VVGATGLDDARVEDLTARAAASGAGLIIVPNFALGAVLLMKFAAEAARHYEHAEIIEMHEKGKIDAPSGTALRTARLMAEAPGSALAAPPGAGQAARGLVADERVTIHSVRLPGAVAHQEVVFGGEDEILTLRHDALSRRSFMGGVLLALRRVGDVGGTVIGLENLLD
jgi:4-hydroxy-tetrahydrodipicolinate reductase